MIGVGSITSMYCDVPASSGFKPPHPPPPPPPPPPHPCYNSKCKFLLLNELCTRMTCNTYATLKEDDLDVIASLAQYLGTVDLSGSGVTNLLKGQMHHHDDLGSKCAYMWHLSNKTTRKSVLLSTPQIWLMKVSKKLA